MTFLVFCFLIAFIVFGIRALRLGKMYIDYLYMDVVETEEEESE